MTPTEGQRRLVIVRRLREICDRDRADVVADAVQRVQNGCRNDEGVSGNNR